MATANGHAECAELVKTELDRQDLGTTREDGIWLQWGVPPKVEFSCTTELLVASPEDQRVLDAALASALDDGLGTSASAAKLRANELVKRHEYAGAAEVYTTALGVLVAINGLCTAVPPPRVQNSGEFNNKIPANVDAWNFYPSVGDPSDHGRTMVFGGCLHTGHPLIKLREQLLANRALCYLKLGWPHSAMSDCISAWLYYTQTQPTSRRCGGTAKRTRPFPCWPLLTKGPRSPKKFILLHQSVAMPQLAHRARKSGWALRTRC